jgi:pyridoxal phosphate enzyme (YggS family)
MRSSSNNNVASNLNVIREKIRVACRENDRPESSVRLVAVSKTKPNELIMEAYQNGHYHFGENYVQELVRKAAELPQDIHWHFIGPLQSNKANLLVRSVVPVSASLTVETVSTLKLANKLDKAMESLEYSHDNKLDIFIQVNTSGEDTKSGVEPEKVVTLCQDIAKSCPHLRIKGLMTIGAPGDLGCFDTLASCRQQVMDALELSTLELSMGMSDDYEQAIARGATNVRVGSSIFGARDYSKA